MADPLAASDAELLADAARILVLFHPDIRQIPPPVSGDKPALARRTPFQGKDLSLLLRKRLIEVDRVARSGPGMGKNGDVCMNKLINTHDHHLRI
jgi:hypothetical protein